jgi:hypothetical protein
LLRRTSLQFRLMRLLAFTTPRHRLVLADARPGPVTFASGQQFLPASLCTTRGRLVIPATTWANRFQVFSRPQELPEASDQ